MKQRSIFILLTFVFCFNTLYLFGQQAELDWNQVDFQAVETKKINEQPKSQLIMIGETSGVLNVNNGAIKISNNSGNKQLANKERVLKILSGQKQKNQSEINFEFESPIVDLRFSIHSYYSVCKGFCKEDTRQLIEVVGYDLNGAEVAPDFILSSQLKDLLKIEGGQILVDKPTQNEIGVSFNQTITGLKIVSKPNKEDAAFLPYLEIGSIYSISNSELTTNPIIPSYNCPKVNITFAIDKSASMDAAELNSISGGLTEIVDYWTSEYPHNEVNLSIVEFAKHATFKQRIKNMDASILEEGTDFNTYLKTGLLTRSEKDSESWTNWESVFDLLQKEKDEGGVNILFFLTDGAANGNAFNRNSFNASLESISQAANQLKKQGFKIYGIGSGDLNEKNAKAWLGQITSGSNSQTISKNELTDFNQLDYVSASDFKTGLTYFKGLPSLFECTEKTIDKTAIDLSVYPNPASSELQINIKSNVQIDSKNNLQIELKNVLGDTVGRYPVGDATNLEIDISTLSSGSYTVLLVAEHSIINYSNFIVVK